MAADEQIPNGSLLLQTDESDIFASGRGAVLVHACNTLGVWGGGIALDFKRLYPHHYKLYRDFCHKNKTKTLEGTALLIGPSLVNKTSSIRSTHWIGCLFTNKDYGKGEVAQNQLKPQILESTRFAMENLLQHLEHAAACGHLIGDIHMPKINAGLFRVPWKDTVSVLSAVLYDSLYNPIGTSNIRIVHVHMIAR